MALPAPLVHLALGHAHRASAAMAATERGTALHLAFRVLAKRPDLADRLPAATGLDPAVLAAVGGQVTALRDWLAAEGFPDLHLELPLHVTHPDGSETLGVIDALAMGPEGLMIIDHKSGPAPDPEARFAGYWPQLAAYAQAVALAFPGRPVRRVAVHWMEEGRLTVMGLELAARDLQRIG